MNMKSTSKDKNNAKWRSSFNVIPFRKPSCKKKTGKDARKTAYIFARQKMKEKYKTNEHSMNIKFINAIIHNESAHIVAMFKDFLIFDDSFEFLRRYYTYMESVQKLPNILEYYETYSKIFANYINLPESKYIYKNIQHKQKMINNLMNKNAGATQDGKDSDNKIFNTELYNSIINQSDQFDNSSFLLQDSIEKNRLASEIESFNAELELDMSHKSYKQDSASILCLKKLIDSICLAEKGSFAGIKEDDGYFSMLHRTGKSKPKTKQKVAKKIIKEYPRQKTDTLTKVNMLSKEIINLHLHSNHSPILPISIKNSNEKIQQEKQKRNINNDPNDNTKNKIKGQLTDVKGKSQLSMLGSCLKKKFNILSIQKSTEFNKKIKGISDMLKKKVSITYRKKKPVSHENERRDKHRQAILGSNPHSNHKTIIAHSTTGTSHNTKSAVSPEIRDTTHDTQSKNLHLDNPRCLTDTSTKVTCTLNNNERKMENIYKYIQTYTSDISKIKKKIVNLVNDSDNAMNSKAKKSCDTKGNNSNCITRRKDHTHMMMYYPNTNCNGTLAATCNASISLQNNSSHSKNQNQKETNLREIIHRDLFEGEDAVDRILRKNVIENTKIYRRHESKIRDNLISIEHTKSQEKINDKCRTIINNSSNNNTKTISQTTNITDKKTGNCTSSFMNNVLINSSLFNKNVNNFTSRGYLLQNIKRLETIIHNKMRSIDSQRQNANANAKAEVLKNVRKINYQKSSRENVKTNSNSRTPKKDHHAMITQRPAKSNFLTGSGCTGRHKILGKIQETAKKLQKKKEVISEKPREGETIKNTLTPNPENKIVLQIKNFYEIVKSNVIVPSANSARGKCSNKVEVRLNSNMKKEKVKLKNYK